MVEISDANEFNEWLGDRPRSVEVQIAWRTAMRVAPVLFKSCPPFDPSGSLELVPHLRALLTTAVLVDNLTDDVVTAGYSAKLGKHRHGNAESKAAAASQCIADAIGGASAFTNPNIKADDTRGMYFRAALLSAEEILGTDHWREVAADADLVEKGVSLFQARLWSGENRFSSDWQAVAGKWSLHTKQWKLWVDWYEDALAGRPPNWDMLTDIARIPDDDWNAGPERVNGLIAGIQSNYRRDSPEAKALGTALLKAALADFDFDSIARLMRMVPFSEDIKHLTGTALEDFLSDAEEIRDGLSDLAEALASGDSAGQGHGQVEVYTRRIASELDRAEHTEKLRVRRYIDLCATLHGYALNEDARQELGPVLAKTLDRQVDAMLTLTRDHFAPSLVRLQPLRNIKLSPNADSAALIRDLTKALNSVRSANSGHAIPLDAEGQAVFDDILDELRRLELAYSLAKSPGEKAELGRQLERKSSSFILTVVRWQITASAAAKTTIGALKEIADYWEAFTNLSDLVKAALKIIRMGSS